MRQDATKWGRWLTDASISSCCSGLINLTLAPISCHIVEIVSTAFVLFFNGVIMQVQPSKRSGNANLMPLCSEPAIGCAPTNAISFLILLVICFTIIAFVLPTSVRIELLFMAGITSLAKSIILSTDVASITISASLTASFAFRNPASIACISTAFSMEEVLWHTPIILLARFLFFRHNPIEPPISPGQIIQTVQKFMDVYLKM